MAKHFTNSIDYRFGVVDLYIVAAPFDHQVRAVRGKMCQLFLHLAPLAVHRFGQISWKPHLIGIVGKYYQWQIAQPSESSNLRGIFFLGGCFRPDRGTTGIPPTRATPVSCGRR